ncbi:MAG: ATP-binding protein [candidate division WOR-3 bacterium]|nr:ATP-binding protein [candidate division WOR-3 bacterium]MDW8151214.1 ATP-binding protein [candidate division WOR-3 bacterium]
MKFIGISVNQTSPYRITFISSESPKIGEYVIVKDEGRELLGMVYAVYSENPYITESIISPDYAQKIRALTSGSIKYRAVVNLLGEITDNGLSSLKSPPKPSSDVFIADNETLKRVFKIEDKNYVKIGTLLNNPDIPVYINLSQSVIRHMAILAITGAGKSNTVAVLIEKISEKNGTAIVFDIHGEYRSFRPNNKPIRIIQPVIDPRLLDVEEIGALIGVDMDASPQMYYILNDVVYSIKKRSSSIDEEDKLDHELNKDFLEDVILELESIKQDKERLRDIVGGNKESLFRLINRLKNLKNRFGTLFKEGATELIKQINEGSINVLDLSGLDEDKADIIISHLLNAILIDKKKTGNKVLSAPIVCILEEAHIFASNRRITRSKYILNRIAREGRKFGIGLWLVSQRPKGLDPDILSQMNNMIILKLVEPEDQNHVQRASESLSYELLEYLPSLNPGEAILIGNMVKIPILVKIDKSLSKLEGHDPNVIEEWLKLNKKVQFQEYI